MIVVADSGSTKADWAFIDQEDTKILHTMGFNPVFHDAELIAQELSQAVAGKIDPLAVTQVYYYGSGCWDDRRKDVIRTALLQVFSNAVIAVHHDLLGAARAACHNEPGIACIMGTGSNSCLYDGTDVIDNVTNLGYLVGDEGSGTHLGKKIIRTYFYREMPAELVPEFEAFVGGGKDFILDHIYGEETPNVYMASFTPFLARHQTHPFVQRILYRSFAEFIDRHVRKYDGHMRVPIHFIGSIADVFRTTLEVILAERSMKTGRFVRKPIDELVAFHRSQQPTMA